MLDPKLVEGMAIYGSVMGTLGFLAAFLGNWLSQEDIHVIEAKVDRVEISNESANKELQAQFNEVDEWLRRLEASDDSQTKRLNDGFNLVNALRKDVAVLKQRQSDQAEFSVEIAKLYRNLLENGTFKLEVPKKKTRRKVSASNGRR